MTKPGLDRINEVVKWNDIKVLLMEYYKVGKGEEGADAYPPLMLLKCMLLQKWFRIASDPEFAALTRRCAAVVYPSCSERTAGSVITCLHAGLILIVSKESGVDTEDFWRSASKCYHR